MFSMRTDQLLNEAIESEYKNCLKYGDKFNSLHEAWAVLKETLEEAGDDLEETNRTNAYIWNLIKIEGDKEDIQEFLTELESYAKQMALGAIQVVANCRKMEKSL